MSVKLFNTLSHRVEEFVPEDPKNVKIYSCGPTVYNYAHIGNFRTFLFNDLLRRYLKYRGYNVNHVVNLTDIDDKTIQGARADGKELRDFTDKYIDIFFQDMQSINIEQVEHYPRATDYMSQMIDFVNDLQQKGVAYSTEGSTYFRIDQFQGYGKLSGIDLSRVQSGLRYDTDEYDKEDIRDFVLWKGTKGDEPSWPAPFGAGRPGWHLECSTMARSILGKTIDIHTGGVDLVFPHHENEIAQSECLNDQTFARMWLHAEHLLVDNAKMSKSKGNLYTLRDLFAQGHSGRALRYFLLSAHYRKKLNFTIEGLEAAQKTLGRIDSTLRRLHKWAKSSPDSHPFGQKDQQYFVQSFIKAMDNDLNISEGLAAFFDWWHNINRTLDQVEKGQMVSGELTAKDILHSLEQVDSVFGFIFDFSQSSSAPNSNAFLSEKEINQLVAERQSARQNKDFAQADEIRDKLQAEGIAIEDTAQGPRWYYKS